MFLVICALQIAKKVENLLVAAVANCQRDGIIIGAAPNFLSTYFAFENIYISNTLMSLMLRE